MSLLEHTPLPRPAPAQPIDSPESFRSRLRELFLESFEEHHFSLETFFSLWFQTHGSGYVFVFKKNLRVTNIQFAELLALFRCHVSDRCTGARYKHLQFLAIQDFEETFRDVLVSFLEGSTPREDGVEQFVSLYAGLLERVIIVQPFFGSCTVFIPPHLALDLASVCAYSGYIHSCGRLVYLADIAKATTAQLLAALHGHVTSRPLPMGKKRKFIIYAHEDFDAGDDGGASVHDGLEKLRIYIDKFYIGGDRLADLPALVEKGLAEFITPVTVPDFRKRKTESWREPQTLWLVTDRSTSDSLEHPGANRYYICYEQLYKNENQFHIFDENKPAWRAPVTIPHTLVGAMINVTRPNWPAAEVIHVGEPFAGSGTVCIEALKYRELTVHSADSDPATALLTRDNLAFFSMSVRQLDNLLRDVEQLGESSLAEPRIFEAPVTRKALAAYNQALQLLDKLTRRRPLSGLDFDDEAIATLTRLGERGRFVFYLVLRAALRNESAFHRKSESWTSAFSRELAAMKRQVRRLRRVRQDQENAQRQGEVGDSGICTHAARFSTACSVNTNGARGGDRVEGARRRIHVADVRDLPADAFDVIITDPPYGFNSEATLPGLARLYADALQAMIRALRRRGQLVLCLPARAYTGRRTPAFIQPSFVTRQVSVQAEFLGRQSQALHYYPISPYLRQFRPPFYWESERALRRGIVHFIID